MPPIFDRLSAFAVRTAGWFRAAAQSTGSRIVERLPWSYWKPALTAILKRLRSVATDAATTVWNDVSGSVRRIAAVPFGTALVRLFIAGFILLMLLIGGSMLLLRIPSTQVAFHEPAKQIVYLDQGWGAGASARYRQLWYYTPQGTSLLGNKMRYSWMVNLERVGGQMFIEPAHMRALGFVVDNIKTDWNPDRLPVGFTKHWDPEIHDDVLDISCAACHTGELHVRVNGDPIAIRIDGGQAMHAFTSTDKGQFGPSLMAAMTATVFNPPRFNRFARRVLGDRYYTGRFALWRDFAAVWWGIARGAVRDIDMGLYPVEEGFGRTDAVGRISNNVFGAEVAPRNFAPADAPASYPSLWNAPRFDFVQYTNSVSQPMARNLGESLGVGAIMTAVDPYGRPVPKDHQLFSTTLVNNLVKLEEAISELQSPKWPEDLLGKIDQEKAARGKVLFEKHCAKCHVPCAETPEMMAIDRPLRDPRNPLWHITPVPVEDIGTDPRAALNFNNVKIDLSRAGIDRNLIVNEERKILEEQKARQVKVYHLDQKAAAALQCAIEQKLDAIQLDDTTIGGGLHYLGTLIANRLYQELNLTPQQQLVYNGEGALDIPEVKMQYRPKPLEGVWATAPYLHNGSVPTLYEMLIPASQRTKRFFISSQLDFDPVRVGLVPSPTSEKGFWLDTSIPGNQNIGHEFRAGYPGHPDHGVIGPELGEEERWEIIEYLKIHRDNPPPCKMPPPPTPPDGCAK
jgi:mono/diheme cytochrome c family protein